MIDSILLIDDEDLFHLVFEDACSLLDMTLSLEALNSSDEADRLFKKWFVEGPIEERPPDHSPSHCRCPRQAPARLRDGRIRRSRSGDATRC